MKSLTVDIFSKDGYRLLLDHLSANPNVARVVISEPHTTTHGDNSFYRLVVSSRRSKQYLKNYIGSYRPFVDNHTYCILSKKPKLSSITTLLSKYL